jgi:hypothetical protein
LNHPLTTNQLLESNWVVSMMTRFQCQILKHIWLEIHNNVVVVKPSCSHTALDEANKAITYH